MSSFLQRDKGILEDELRAEERLALLKKKIGESELALSHLRLKQDGISTKKHTQSVRMSAFMFVCMYVCLFSCTMPSEARIASTAMVDSEFELMEARQVISPTYNA